MDILIDNKFDVFYHMQSSWKLSLQNSFKNFRWGYMKKNATSDESAPPPTKRLKVCCIDEPDITEEEYHDAVKQLQGEQYLECHVLRFQFIF